MDYQVEFKKYNYFTNEYLGKNIIPFTSETLARKFISECLNDYDENIGTYFVYTLYQVANGNNIELYTIGY